MVLPFLSPTLSAITLMPPPPLWGGIRTEGGRGWMIDRAGAGCEGGLEGEEWRGE